MSFSSLGCVVLSVVASCLLIAGCGNTIPAPVCTPGRVESCPCSGGRSGIQQCLPSGTFDVCVCDELDGASNLDAGANLDAGDARVPNDAATQDAPNDGGNTDDVGTLDAFVGHDAGTLHGHAVLFGFDGARTNDSTDTLLTNAVFLSERPVSGDLRILVYDQYTPMSSDLHMRSVLADAALARHRTLAYSELAAPSASALTASLASADVLLIEQQINPSSDLHVVGASWHDALIAFLDSGGVIVVLSNLTQVSGAAHTEWALVSGTGLFNTASSPGYAGVVACEIVGTADPLAIGVVSTWTDQMACLDMMTGGALVARTSQALSYPTGCPVARHITH